MLDINDLMTEGERSAVGVERMSAAQRQALLAFAMRMYQIGNSSSIVSSTIDEVKYSGHLIVLDDGSRWEVDEADIYTADMWSMLDDVVVIDGNMYRLDDLEKISVTRED